MCAYAKTPGKRRVTVRKNCKVKRKPRKSIATIVKSVISRQAETKSWFEYGSNQSITTVSLTLPTNENLLPTLTQSTGHSGRIGNEIKIKGGFIKGHVNLLPYNVSTNVGPVPIYVKMWILSSKEINGTTLSLTTIDTDLFDIVNSSTSFQGNMLDIDFSINKDMWICHASKTVKLGSSYSVGAYVATGGYFDNSPMSVPFYFNFGKYLKTLKYDDSLTSPTNRNMFIVFQCVAADGSNATGQVKAEYHYTTRVDYTDM